MMMYPGTGKKVLSTIDCGRGNPFSTPEEILEIARMSITAGSGYVDPIGDPELRNSIAESIHRELQLRFDPEQEILVSAGATPAIAASILALSDPGDTILVPDPGWPSYSNIIRAFGRKDYRYRVEPFLREEALTEIEIIKPKAIILNTPHNPTGKVLKEEDFDRLAILMSRYPDLLILSDEVYNTLVFDAGVHRSPVTHPELRHHCVAFRSFSKTHSMPDWRIGFVFGPKSIMQRVESIHRSQGSFPSALAQKVAATLLREDRGIASGLRSRYLQNRDFLVRNINEIPGFHVSAPEGAMYLFPAVPESGNRISSIFSDQLNIHVLPGERFGESGAGHIRMCLALDSLQIADLASRLKQFQEAYS
jgi:aminotransferase